MSDPFSPCFHYDARIIAAFLELWAMIPIPAHALEPSYPRNRLRESPYFRFRRLIFASPPARKRFRF
ncbi:hypothetical protein SAMN04488025_1262 [Planifilum fulgidum]|uniref:Uncharacterized protein n=1 Tax=Planifilum fulgidum TaxID=201973 RepID=A0A1I2QUZ1_9BACL|nr:hypothetical protein SAMN04488025_1262 [Planifilum fulgidum]